MNTPVRVGSARVGSASGAVRSSGLGARRGLGSVSGQDVDLYVYLKDRTALDRIKSETPVSVTTNYLTAAYTISQQFRAGVQEILPQGTVEIIEKPVEGRETPDTVGVIGAGATRQEVEGFVDELVGQAREQTDSKLNEAAVQILFEEIVVSDSAPNPENWTRNLINPKPALFGRGPIPVLEWTNVIEGSGDDPGNGGGDDPGNGNPPGRGNGGTPGFQPTGPGGGCPDGFKKVPLDEAIRGPALRGRRGLGQRNLGARLDPAPGPGRDPGDRPGVRPIDPPDIIGDRMVCVPKDPADPDPPGGPDDPGNGGGDDPGNGGGNDPGNGGGSDPGGGSPPEEYEIPVAQPRSPQSAGLGLGAAGAGGALLLGVLASSMFSD